MTRRKTSFSISSPSSKLTISLIVYTIIILGYITRLLTRVADDLFLHASWKLFHCWPLVFLTFFSSLVRRPSCGNSHVILLRYHASMQPRLHSTKLSTFKMFTPWRSSYWLQRLKIRAQFWCAKFWTLGRPNFRTFGVVPCERDVKRTNFPPVENLSGAMWT